MNARLISVPQFSASTSKKDALVTTLRGLLQSTFRLQREGARTEKLCQAQGYADGFMRALLESGAFSDRELLEIVRDTRRGIDGPSTKVLTAEDTTSAA